MLLISFSQIHKRKNIYHDGRGDKSAKFFLHVFLFKVIEVFFYGEQIPLKNNHACLKVDAGPLITVTSVQ